MVILSRFYFCNPTAVSKTPSCSSHLINIHPLEGGLQEFEVVDVFMLQLGLEFHLLKTDTAGKQHVHELTVRCSCNMK